MGHKRKYPRDLAFYQKNYAERDVTLGQLAGELGNPNIAKSGKLKRILENLGIRVRKRTDDQWGDKNHAWKGGRVGGGQGYILIKQYGHHRSNKRGYVFEHILVWEKANNRLVPRGFVIHHINNLRDDNRIENLQFMTANEHNYINLKDARLRRKEFLAEMARLREENRLLREQLRCQIG